jgi:hypothetical protein
MPGKLAVPVLRDIMLRKIFSPMVLMGILFMTFTMFFSAWGSLAFAVSPWEAQAKLSATGGAASDRFGFSAALSADGNVAIVGSIVGNTTVKGKMTVSTGSVTVNKLIIR